MTTNKNKGSGADSFAPDLRKPKKSTLAVTISDDSKAFLGELSRMYNINTSAFIDSLILTVKHSSCDVPITYTTELGQYREIRLLLRKEVADFLEMWKMFGKVGSKCINNDLVKPSTPMQIAEKLSFIIADNPEIMECDSAIYGHSKGYIESKYQRAGDKAKELPTDMPQNID